VQSEIVSALLDSIGVEVLRGEGDRASRKTTNLNAYDAVWKGIYKVRLLSRDGNSEARRWFQHAIELDPTFAEPHALLSVVYSSEGMMGWNLDPAFRNLAKKHARRCVELDPQLAQCRSALAAVALAAGNTADAVRQAGKAIELAPGFFAGHAVLGMALGRDGQPLRAIEPLKRAIRLDPNKGTVAGALGLINFRVGREREAIEIFERQRSSYPDALPARIVLASTSEAAGDRARARTLIGEILAINPDLTVAQLPQIGVFRALGPKDVAAIQENLRNAGFPDALKARHESGSHR